MIGNTVKDEIYKDAIAKYGVQMQHNILIEEMAELTQAVMKVRRKDGSIIKNTIDLLEELMDVEIMIEQMRRHYENQGFTDSMNDLKVKKLERLRKRLDEQ